MAESFETVSSLIFKTAWNIGLSHWRQNNNARGADFDMFKPAFVVDLNFFIWTIRRLLLNFDFAPPRGSGILTLCGEILTLCRLTAMEFEPCAIPDGNGILIGAVPDGNGILTGAVPDDNRILTRAILDGNRILTLCRLRRHWNFNLRRPRQQWDFNLTLLYSNGVLTFRRFTAMEFQFCAASRQ